MGLRLVAYLLVFLALLSPLLAQEMDAHAAGEGSDPQECRFLNISGYTFDLCSFKSSETNMKCSLPKIGNDSVWIYANPFSKTVNKTCEHEETPICLRIAQSDFSLGNATTESVYCDSTGVSCYFSYSGGDFCMEEHGLVLNYSSKITFVCSETEEVECATVENCTYSFTIKSPQCCFIVNNASTSYAYGSGFSEAVAGVTGRFIIETRDSSGELAYNKNDDVSVTLLTPLKDANVSVYSPGKYEVTYETCAYGMVGVISELNGEEFGFSESIIEVKAGIAEHLTVSGKGIPPNTDTLFIYEVQSFTVDAFDICGNVAVNYSLNSIFFPTNYVSLNECVPEGNSRHCAYISSVIGEVKIALEVVETHVVYGNWTTNIFHVGTEAISIYGPGVNPTGPIEVNTPQTFSISAMDAIGNPPTIEYEFLISDNSSLISGAYCILSNATDLCCYTCTYIPRGIGCDSISVFFSLYGDYYLAGGPYKVDIVNPDSSSSAPTPSHSSASSQDIWKDVYKYAGFAALLVVLLLLTAIVLLVLLLAQLSVVTRPLQSAIQIPIQRIKGLREKRIFEKITENYDSDSEDSLF